MTDAIRRMPEGAAVKNAKIQPTAPASPGPAPASSTSIESVAWACRSCSGAGARPDKVPIMTAAHSRTPAAVFVIQHTHSTTNP